MSLANYCDENDEDRSAKIRKPVTYIIRLQRRKRFSGLLCPVAAVIRND